jgi:hypothetical protein
MVESTSGKKGNVHRNKVDGIYVSMDWMMGKFTGKPHI